MFDDFIIPHEKIMCFTFCCLTEQQNLITHETFANYSSYMASYI